MRYNHIRSAGLVLALLAMPTLRAQQPRFEAVVAGGAVACISVLPPFTAAIEWMVPDAGFPGSQADDLASAPGQPVYAASSGNVYTILPDGTRTLFFNGVPAVSAITVASTGRVFARSATTLAVISAAGVLETTYPLPDATGMIAVASDGCTLYYQKTASIGRINGCTGALLSDFAPLPALFTDLYPLPNGTVLVSSETTIVLHDPSGIVIRTIANRTDYGFDTERLFKQVAASPDGRILYVAVEGCDPGILLTASMQDGFELSRRSLEYTTTINALVVGSASAPGVPTASETALLILAIVLALGGAFILKR